MEYRPIRLEVSHRDSYSKFILNAHFWTRYAVSFFDGTRSDPQSDKPDLNRLLPDNLPVKARVEIHDLSNFQVQLREAHETIVETVKMGVSLYNQARGIIRTEYIALSGAQNEWDKSIARKISFEIGSERDIAKSFTSTSEFPSIPESK